MDKAGTVPERIILRGNPPRSDVKVVPPCKVVPVLAQQEIPFEAYVMGFCSICRLLARIWSRRRGKDDLNVVLFCVYHTECVLLLCFFHLNHVNDRAGLQI